jgi:hypothetical protein
MQIPQGDLLGTDRGVTTLAAPGFFRMKEEPEGSSSNAFPEHDFDMKGESRDNDQADTVSVSSIDDAIIGPVGSLNVWKEVLHSLLLSIH